MPRALVASAVTGVLAGLILLTVAASSPRAQPVRDPVWLQRQNPVQMPRVSAGDLHYLGSFDVDASDGSGAETGSLAYGGRALSVNPATNTLLISGHTWYSRLCEVSIPDDFVRGARVLQPCTDVTGGKLSTLDDGDIYLGGSLVYDGRLIVSAYSFYDADDSQQKSHFVAGLKLGDRGAAQGPFRVGEAEPAGFVSGYMGIVPEAWRSRLGGPAVTGNCCLSIISRTSSGPALSAFDPDDLGRSGDVVPAVELLGYPLNVPLTAEAGSDLRKGSDPLFNLTAEIKGVAFPAGTRSVLFIGKIGTGPYCYGDEAECPDPATSYKGPHAYPYRHQIWAYDANDLADVKSGNKRPWEVRPYATWPLTEMNDSGSASIAGATYDPATRRLYVTEAYGDQPKVHVYEIAGEIGAR